MQQTWWYSTGRKTISRRRKNAKERAPEASGDEGHGRNAQSGRRNQDIQLVENPKHCRTEVSKVLPGKKDRRRTGDCDIHMGQDRIRRE